MDHARKSLLTWMPRLVLLERSCYNNCMNKPKRPRDTNQLAKSIVDIATGEAEDKNPNAGKDPAAVALGKKGGLVGGKKRAEKLSSERRSEIAKKAAAARWKKNQ